MSSLIGLNGVTQGEKSSEGSEGQSAGGMTVSSLSSPVTNATTTTTTTSTIITTTQAAPADATQNSSTLSTIPATTPKTTSKMSSRSAAIPRDAVRLDVLLTTGQRKFFDFAPSTSVKGVRESIWQDWPEDWPPRPINASAIRVLHLGHILDDKAILAPTGDAAGAARRGAAATGKAADDVPSTPGAMTAGKCTVVHLLIRQAPTKAHGDDESLKKTKDVGAGCCTCVIC